MPWMALVEDISRPQKLNGLRTSYFWAPKVQSCSNLLLLPVHGGHISRNVAWLAWCLTARIGKEKIKIPRQLRRTTWQVIKDKGLLTEVEIRRVSDFPGTVPGDPVFGRLGLGS